MSCVADGWSLPVAAVFYALFTLLAIAAPALALLRLLRLRIDPAVIVPLGLALCAGAYWLSLLSTQAWLFPACMLALDATLVWRWRAPWRLAEGPSLRGALAPLAVLVAVFAVTQYPLNRCLPDGSFALDPLERVDTAFHVALTWELAEGYPPQVPGLAGVRLGYHFGPHLVRAAALRWAGVHPYDALTRFDLTLWTLALVLALRGGAWALGAPPAAIALAAWTPLAADASFLFARHADATWWTELLGANVLLALFFTNALVPALALALGVLSTLKRGAEEAPGWLVVGGVLGLALPSFKIFLAAQLLLGLAVALLVARRRWATALVALPCLAATLALGCGPGAHTARVLFEPLGAAQALRAALALEPAHGLALLGWGGLWTVTALGLRLIGLQRAGRALGAAPWACALGVMALCGWPLRWLVRVTADGKFDEAVYFSVASGALLWLFAAWELASLLTARGRRPLLLGALAAGLCLPTSLQFLLGRALTPAERVPAGVLAAMSTLAQVTRPGEVVLQTSFSRWPPPPVVFVGRRVAYTEFMPYMEQFAPPDVLAERLRQVRRFFKTRDVDEARALASGLGARFVCVFGRTPARATLQLLEPVFESEDASLYRLPGTSGK